MAVIINTPPKAEPERLSRLVERVNAGEIKIPKFQRGFVWQRPAVIALLESILQGYPIGSLLFWRTEQKLNFVLFRFLSDMPALPQATARPVTRQT